MSDTKKAITSPITLGFGQARKACVRMQPAACYWITVSPEEDAQLLAQHCASGQRPVAIICSGSGAEDLLPPPATEGTPAIPQLTLPATEEALMSLAEDPATVLPHLPGVILFFTTASLWEKLSAARRYAWMKRMQASVAGLPSTLLIITSVPEAHSLRPQLQTFYRYLSGLSHLSRHQDHWDYRISWWADNHDMLTDRTLRLSFTAGRFTQISQDQQATSPVPEDEHIYLLEHSVPEGEPVQASHWCLFENNAALYTRAREADAATVVFSLNQSEEIASLAGYIHSLRRSRGSALKIVVREKHAALRYGNERLLLACGVNAIVPFSAPVTRLFATLAEIQGHTYNRHVPAELDVLLRSLHPLQERGYLDPACFSRSVTERMNNVQLPEKAKGLLIAFERLSGVTAEAVLSQCKPRRFGDVFTLAEDRLWLFLSSCRYSDLDTALRFIFRQPYEEMFSSRTVWHEEAEIIGQTAQIESCEPHAQAVFLTPRGERQNAMPGHVPSDKAP